jgi:hypothetical protein
MDPRTGKYDAEKIKVLALPGLEFRPLGRPARSQSLYRLRYPGSALYWCSVFFGLSVCDCLFLPARVPCIWENSCFLLMVTVKAKNSLTKLEVNWG